MSSEPQGASQQKPLISVAEAGKLAGLTRSVAYRLAAQNQLPGLVRLPDCRLMVRRRMLEAWLAGTDPSAGSEEGAPSYHPGAA